MFTLTKDKFKFFKTFSTLIGATTNASPVISIITEQDKVYFVFEDYDYILVNKILDVKIEKEFVGHWDAKQFVNLVSHLLTLDTITISQEGIFTKTGKFSFQLKTPIHDMDFIKNKLLGAKIKDEYVFNNLNDLHIAKSFIGINDKECRYISFNKKYLFASDTIIFYRSLLKNMSSGNEYQLFLDINIAKALPIDFEDGACKCKIKIYDNSAFWSFYLEDYNLDIFINYETFSIPDLDTEEYKQQYIHNNYAIVNTDEFYEKLYIMSISAVQNLNNGIHLTLKDNKLYFNNKNKENLAQDYIECKYNLESEGISLFVNCKQLLKFKKLFSKNLKMSFALDKPAMRFQNYEMDNKEDDRLILYARLNDI